VDWLDGRPLSHEQAVMFGQAHGRTARDLCLPPDFFSESLKTLTDLWRSAGCDPSWVDAGDAAARSAYWGPAFATAPANASDAPPVGEQPGAG